MLGVKLLFDYASTFPNFYWVIGGYVLLAFLLYNIRRHIRSNALHFILQAVLFPVSIIFKFFTVVFPVLATQVYLLVYLILSFSIPVILYILDQSLVITPLKTETWIYIIATFGSITATLFHPQITTLTFKIIPFTASKSSKTKRIKLVEMCKYIVSKSNIKIVIYFIFFVTLIIFTILGLQESSYYENSNIDNALIQSFVTFIAFERIVGGLELTKFRASELLQTMKFSKAQINKKKEE